MVRHSFIHPSNKNKESHKCQFCKKHFDTSNRLNDHIKKDHHDEVKVNDHAKKECQNNIQDEVKVTQFVSSPVTFSLPIMSGSSDLINTPTLLIQNFAMDPNGHKFAQPIFSSFPTPITTTNMALIGPIITSQNQLLVQPMPNETLKPVEIVDLVDEDSVKSDEIDISEDEKVKSNPKDEDFQCKSCLRSFKYASFYNVHLKHCF